MHGRQNDPADGCKTRHTMNEAGDPRIIFLGTPVFAVASLHALVEAGYHVAAVITAPDKPSGRGLEVHQSEVKKYAIQRGIRVLQPEKLSDPDFLAEVKNLKADLQVVVAFRMMPEKLWSMPPLGTFNLHASLLPQYRGAAPINHAIINGESETGVTTFFLRHEIDTGDILMNEKLPIGENETAGELHDRLMMAGARLVVATTARILDGSIAPQPQPAPAGLKAAPKIFREQCRIRWEETGAAIHNLVRGLSPYPVAWTEFISHDGRKTTVRIYACEPVKTGNPLPPGLIDTDRKSYIHISCADGYVNILSIQLPGRKRMDVPGLLRGFRINEEWHAE